MDTQRKISKVFKSKPVLEGAGVLLKRAFGFSQLPLFDPFLLLDDFRSANPEEYLKGFPWHPHRGIETITYVLDGYVEHADSMGNRGIISGGDVQWMTAGSGIIHEEMPFGNERGALAGFQLWANLPASEKMTPPRYRDVKSSEIPALHLDNGVEIRIICGKYDETLGPVTGIAIDPEYLDITLPPGVSFSRRIPGGRKAFAYVIAGKGLFCNQDEPFGYDTEGVSYFDMESSALLENETLVLFGDGDGVTLTTEDDPLRILLISGNPLNEPVAWHGPIVMNTREELRRAFEEFQNGTFVRTTG
ncbi:MAG: pirin family protein [Chlorobium sp.]|uniref:pirin family protein n=1 Tax=Chlorobium sp. TaxID=1095 RepID=UPI0025C0F724|nr:pirin family protein [Chlorobium sp.]MCF8384076.1 pirin family protein [Chlorobium sp.]